MFSTGRRAVQKTSLVNVEYDLDVHPNPNFFDCIGCLTTIWLSSSDGGDSSSPDSSIGVPDNSSSNHCVRPVCFRSHSREGRKHHGYIPMTHEGRNLPLRDLAQLSEKIKPLLALGIAFWIPFPFGDLRPETLEQRK